MNKVVRSHRIGSQMETRAHEESSRDTEAGKRPIGIRDHHVHPGIGAPSAQAGSRDLAHFCDHDSETGRGTRFVAE